MTLFAARHVDVRGVRVDRRLDSRRATVAADTAAAARAERQRKEKGRVRKNSGSVHWFLAGEE
jgi:hypothetical protein